MQRYRLSAAAQADIVDILALTEERFGKAARVCYEMLIIAALRDIAEDPERPGAPVRPELGVGARLAFSLEPRPAPRKVGPSPAPAASHRLSHR